MPADANAKRRASFAAADRRKKDAAKTVEQSAAQHKAAEAKKADQQKAMEAKKAEQQRKIAAADRKAEQRRGQQRKEQVKKDFTRQAEDKKALAKADQQKQDAQRQAAQEKQRRADERKAAAYVAERQKAQQADALAEQRRQTSRLRTQHREETRSLKQNESTALNRHWHAVKSIDSREQRALHEFGVKRGSMAGRAAELVKGKKHFDAQRKEIVDRHEADRMKQHRDLEALKERQFKIAQDTRLRQVQERKAIFDKHRDESRDLTKTQEADRPRQIEDRKQAFAKAAEIEQAHKQERTQERGQGPKLSM